jgi:phage terminase small subunit
LIRVRTPTHLSREATRLFRAIIAKFEIEDERAVHFLTMSCEQFDRMKDAARIISEKGAVIKDRYGGLKQNPALLVEARAQKQHIAALREAIAPAQHVPVVERRAEARKRQISADNLVMLGEFFRANKP